MTMFEQLIRLKDSGFLVQMVKSGLMSFKVYSYLEIYMWVDARHRATGKSLGAVVEDAVLEFGISRSTVWRALRTIRSVGE